MCTLLKSFNTMVRKREKMPRSPGAGSPMLRPWMGSLCPGITMSVTVNMPYASAFELYLMPFNTSEATTNQTTF